jgi:hypothetical protein
MSDSDLEDDCDWTYEDLKADLDDETFAELEGAATTIQRLYRFRFANKRVVERVRTIYTAMVDPYSGHRYFYNSQTGQEQWEKPLVLKDRPFVVMNRTDAAVKLQGAWRAKQARLGTKDLVRSVYSVEWDDDSGFYFYKNNMTGEGNWEKPLTLGAEEIDPDYPIVTKGALIQAEQDKRLNAPQCRGVRTLQVCHGVCH